MNSSIFDLAPVTPNKRKQEHLDDRDDDAIVTPHSDYGESSDSSPRDTSFLSTPTTPSFESPLKKRRTCGGFSQLSPPLMPRLKYRSEQTSRSEYPSPEYFERGRLVLDIYEQTRDELAFLAIPTPPSRKDRDSSEKIPSFELSPRTTLAPRFPELEETRRRLVWVQRREAPFLGNDDDDDEKENENTTKSFVPTLRMRPSHPSKLRVGRAQMRGELTLPTLSDFTLGETPKERSPPAVAA